MTERLVDDPAAVSALARRTANLLDLLFSHVEMDFWATEVLRESPMQPVVTRSGSSSKRVQVYRSTTSVTVASNGI